MTEWRRRFSLIFGPSGCGYSVQCHTRAPWWTDYTELFNSLSLHSVDCRVYVLICTSSGLLFSLLSLYVLHRVCVQMRKIAVRRSSAREKKKKKKKTARHYCVILRGLLKIEMLWMNEWMNCTPDCVFTFSDYIFLYLLLLLFPSLPPSPFEAIHLIPNQWIKRKNTTPPSCS